MQNTIFLTDDQKVMWAEAGTTFPGEQLDRIVQRALIDLPLYKLQNDFYELRRFDAPRAFDALLKLQNTGCAQQHIEVDEYEFREVLRIEVALFELIMQAIAMILDVFLRVLGGAFESTSVSSAEPPVKPPTMAPIPQKHIPGWKSQLRIDHDNYGYTP